MRLALEVFQANQGDALLLHWGTKSDPHLMLVDGGPSGIYDRFLRPRLLELAAQRPSGVLDIDAVMVSHVDDDHINGIEGLFEDLASSRRPPVRVRRLWMNAFDKLAQPDDDDGFVALGELPTSVSGRLTAHASREALAVIASVAQGDRVAALADELGLSLSNPPFRGLIQTDGKHTSRALRGLQLSVLGPNRARIDDLRSKWLAASAPAASLSTLADLDDSITNLSSIVMEVSTGTRRLLLTGDARGDDILHGLRARGSLATGTHFDLLKVPHHGSDRNVDTEFFRTVTADHYVISGDGTHHNPELATLDMLTEARRGSKFTIHLTNGEPRVRAWFERNGTAGDRYEVRYRPEGDLSMLIHLSRR